MSINFNELNKDGPVKTKEQILAEMKRTIPAYFYDGAVRGEQAYLELSSRNYWGDEDFEDVPF